ncbi:MAG: tetratricopeptide repeat protein [Ignavibacteria bacterium]|nr:tetratricopeptide repeat protein [Ignavibacteria bacterium]
MHRTLFAMLFPLITVTICYGQTAVEWADRGDTKRVNSDYRGAIADCSKAIELDPTLAAAYYTRGDAKRMLQDYRGAMGDLNKAIELDPTFAMAYFTRGDAKRVLED